MSEEKLSSEQVPEKFTDWLVSMGCPPEDIPPLDTMSEMCRGHMVWQSLMENVEPKDDILTKRLQVFLNDIAKWRNKNVLNTLDVNVPEELSLWQQHNELKEQVADAEASASEEHDQLNQIMNKVSRNLIKRNLLKKKIQNAQRRSWLLQQVSAQLQEQKVNLQEAKTIANSLCCHDESLDVQSTLDKCLSAMSRSNATSRATVSQPVANPVASSSIASTSDNDTEELMSSLVKCRADVIFKQLLERRERLCSQMTSEHHLNKKDKQTPQAAVGRMAALHCNLVLGALKNKARKERASQKVAKTLKKLNDKLSTEVCEELVTCCEKVQRYAREKTLRKLNEEMLAREGAFAGMPATGKVGKSKEDVLTLNKAIISKRDELKRLIASVADVERKTKNVKENLEAIFAHFHSLEKNNDHEFCRLCQISATLPQESISSIRQFYEEQREKHHKKLELSTDCDVSQSRSNELAGNRRPKFVDELKMYLNKFCLENNRTLVLESGEKLWVSETVQSGLERLYAESQNSEFITSMLCPSVSLAENLASLTQKVAMTDELEILARSLENWKIRDISIDITPLTKEEEATNEKIKKQLSANILSLQKTDKRILLGIENLDLWDEDNFKQYISDDRMVEGRRYEDYEKMFEESSSMSQ